MVMKDEREASGERTTLPPEYDSAYLQDASSAPTETLTVFFENPEKFLVEAADSIRKAEAARQLKTGLAVATLGVLSQYTFRQEYVVYDSSQARHALAQAHVGALLVLNYSVCLWHLGDFLREGLKSCCSALRKPDLPCVSIS